MKLTETHPLTSLEPGSLANGQIEVRFDTAEWLIVDTPDEYTTLTSSGRSLLAAGNVRHLLREYCSDLLNGNESPTDTRRFIAEGGNARVFSVGDSGLAVKEKRRGSHDGLLESLERMDHLSYVIESSCPRWIGIPKNYGVLTPYCDPDRQFMLMQKVDEGITLGDIVGANEQPREDHLEVAMYQAFGDITPELQAHLMSRFNVYKQSLEDGIRAAGHTPAEYLPDFYHNLYNTIVEPLETPIAGSYFKFTVIDQ